MSEHLSAKTIFRMVAIQTLYLIDFNNIDFDNEKSIEDAFQEVISNHELELQAEKPKKFMLSIIKTILSNIENIDQVISAHLVRHKDINQLNTMIKSILRCGVGELKHFKTPFKVVVSEYVDLARDFVHPNEVNFTNAILDKIAKSTIPSTL